MALTKVRGSGIGSVDGGVTIDNITIDGTEIDLSSGDLTLDVHGDIILDANGGDLIFQDDGTEIAHLSNSSSDFKIESKVSDKDIIFRGNDGGSGIEAMRIDMSAGGYVYINATSSQDSGMFFVDGTGENANAIIARVNNDLFWNYVGNNSSGTNTFLVYGNGNVQSATNSYGSTSDEKLKENIEDSGSQWDDIKAVKVKKFSLKSDKQSKANMLGVIAQDLEASGMNGLVENNPDRDEDMNDVGTVTKAVKYSILYMKAIKALQEAMARIETLETKVTALESK
tara:strand:+ start:18 stop:869 length:852 start_codon:yes stop_codon:yes gene_type:complete